MWPAIHQLSITLPALKGQWLDMGCGCGVLGLMSLHSGLADHVTLVDIDPAAVRFSRKNAENHGLFDACDVMETNMWNGVDGKIYGNRRFSVVLANIPLTPTLPLPGDTRNPFRTYNMEWMVQRTLFNEAPAALLPGGLIMMLDTIRARYLEQALPHFDLLGTLVSSTRRFALSGKKTITSIGEDFGGFPR